MIVERCMIQCSSCGEFSIRYARRTVDTGSEYNRMVGGVSNCSFCRKTLKFTPAFSNGPNVDIGDSVVVWDEVAL